MSARGLLTVGFTVQEVLAIQARAKADLLSGKVLTSYSEGGVSATKQIVMSTEKLLDECKYALQYLDPVAYPKPKRFLTSDYSRGRNL
ncbi:hypothetical protein UFOVP510_18 [uncultured Caudovirales phage]|uniref:Uncharacterized protein n=1 Tax=uncultured Caudovirales phage TaxID=2100421 RepID=A0A6J5MUG9_9CAUD|nr:hypothetical protein UFOVP510_18 [uncultured Caudovirales phage]